MASAYTRGKTIFVKYKEAPGKYKTVHRDDEGERFTTELKAEKWGNWKEEEIKKAQHREANSPTPAEEREDITFEAWVAIWWPNHGAGLALLTRRSYLSDLDVHLLDRFGPLPLRQITPIVVAGWLQKMRADEYRYKPNTIDGCRRLLALILGDAVDEGLIDSNPAEAKRRRGRVVQHDDEDETEETVWPTPLQALLLAERCALMAGPKHGFIVFMLVLLKAYTGMRFGEIVGLRWEWVKEEQAKLKVHWQLSEDGPLFLQPPKYGSRRWIDLPPFLVDLLIRLRELSIGKVCTCKPRKVDGQQEQPCPGRQAHVFLGPRGGHFRASNFRDRTWHPAVEGQFAEWSGDVPRPTKPVMVDMSKGWPGVPVRNSWPAAVAGEPFVIPRGRGVQFYNPETVHLASWVALLEDLTPHGLRHGHQVLIDDLMGATEAWKKARMGHKPRGVDKVYRHVSAAAIAAGKAGLQEVFEQSLRERFALCPTSPVPALDAMLAPLREASQTGSCRKDVENPSQALPIPWQNRAWTWEDAYARQTSDLILPRTLPAGD